VPDVGSGGGWYQNPVIHADAPDPGAAWDPDTKAWWVAVTGGTTAAAFRLYTSPDLANGTWTAAGWVFPHGAPAWSSQTEYWAPELHFVNGTWTAYFAAYATEVGHYCIGVAKSAGGIGGPYVDVGMPLIVESDWGSIDPTFFADDDGKSYVIWKRDGNAVGAATPIFATPLDATGTVAVGANVQLITDTEKWEDGITEAPWMIAVNHTYYLFYSGSGYSGTGYAIGVATAPAATGPFTKVPSPIIHTATGKPPFYGPGHCSVVWTGSEWALVYAAWNVDGSGRNILLDALLWKDGIPGPAGGVPSTTAQPLP